MIKRACRSLIKRYHPDKYPDISGYAMTVLNDIFNLINESYNCLSAERDRKRYEEFLKAGKQGDFLEVSKNTISSEIHFQNGKQALKRWHFKEAADSLEQAVKMKPDEMEYKAYLGWAIFNLNPKDRERAGRLVENGLSLDKTG